MEQSFLCLTKYKRLLRLKAKVLISAGSNIGDRKNYLQQAINLLMDNGFVQITSSSIYQTPPWGFDADTPFYNVCFSGYTDLSPTRFIRLLIEIEEKLGRVRSSENRYTSRTIDLDVILWDRLLISSPILTVPHPRAHERRFVLEPAVEIEADWIHPVFNATLKTLLENCKDVSTIERLPEKLVV